LATTLDQIVDLFMSFVSDFRLTTIYQTSGSSIFQTYIEPWVIGAVVDFSKVCDQSLNYSQATQSFDTDLTLENQFCLAQITVKYWAQKVVQDITQINVYIKDHDFDRHSENSNFTAKQSYYIGKIEEIDHMLSVYAYDRNDWNLRYQQNFGQAIINNP